MKYILFLIVVCSFLPARGQAIYGRTMAWDGGYGITPKVGKSCLLSPNRQGMPTGLLKDSSGCRTNESALKE